VRLVSGASGSLASSVIANLARLADLSNFLADEPPRLGKTGSPQRVRWAASGTVAL